MKRFAFLAMALGAIAVACSDDASDSYSSGPIGGRELGPAAAASSAMTAFGEDVNAQLATQGTDVRLGGVEWYTSGDDGEAGGQIVFFNDRGNKELALHFVPGDPRRGGRTNITYLVDQSGGNTNDGLTNAQTEAAIDRAMGTWEAENCSTIPIVKVADTGADPDLIDELIPEIPDDGPGRAFAADIVHGGWSTWIASASLPANVLAATFTFIFTSGGNPTDIDTNKRGDVAWREIYYNDGHLWRINGTFDVETVALHEAGHGLSQGHFGKAFRTTSNNLLHFAPLAVMNAGYSQIQQALAGTDNGGHCTNWGSWPNN